MPRDNHKNITQPEFNIIVLKRLTALAEKE